MTMPKEPSALDSNDVRAWKTYAYNLREHAEGLEKFVPDAMRYRLLCSLFNLEMERLLRSHLNVAGGTVETLCDAAMMKKGAERE